MKTIAQITEEIRNYDGWYCHLMNTLFDIEDESETAVFTAEKLEDILDSDEYVEAKANPEQNEILCQMLNAEWMNTMAYEIKKRIIPEKKATLPIFRDIPEREEYYFYNESGVEQIAPTLEEAKKLVKENKAYYRMKREMEREDEEWLRNRGKL